MYPKLASTIPQGSAFLGNLYICHPASLIIFVYDLLGNSIRPFVIDIEPEEYGEISTQSGFRC